MRAEHASELDELKSWVDAVRPLPRFLRTKDARGLMDALERLELTTTFEAIASQLGKTREDLLAALRKCPFGVSLSSS